MTMGDRVAESVPCEVFAVVGSELCVQAGLGCLGIISWLLGLPCGEPLLKRFCLLCLAREEGE